MIQVPCHNHVEFFSILKVMHEVYEDTVKRLYIPEGNVEPNAAGVEKLEFVIPDNGME